MNGNERVSFVRASTLVLMGVTSFVGLLSLSGPIFPAEPATNAGDIEFFEKRIRPVLVEQCQSCHSTEKPKGGLSLDHRAGWQKGGDSGAAVLPGKPDESLLIRAIRHQAEGLEMPAKAPKLSDRVIGDFVTWIANGAVDPRDAPAPTSTKRNWEEVFRERSQWWSFQPLRPRSTPARGSSAIDHWINAELAMKQITPSSLADDAVVVRRLFLQLTGLPPTSTDLDQFRADGEHAWESLVDRLLASTRFGEHWARHWMDVVHYAETYGSEDDAYMPFSYRYRDYLIRAINHDVPFQQLIREHVAGDLIEPRWNETLEENEAMIGTAFWRFVEFNQTPVDVKREEIAVIDSQIDTLGKAFQGMTIACARCHDHKFDPISADDYYALYGVLRSTRSGLRIIDAPHRFVKHHDELRRLAVDLKSQLISRWAEEVSQWSPQITDARLWLREILVERADASGAKTNPKEKDKLRKELESRLPEQPWVRALFAAAGKPNESSLGPLAKILSASDNEFTSMYRQVGDAERERHRQSVSPLSNSTVLFDFSDGGLAGGRVTGAGLDQDGVNRPGALLISNGAPSLVSAIAEQGYYSNRISDRQAGILRTPDFVVDGVALSVLACGHGNARVRLVMENFQGDSLLFATVNPDVNHRSLHWYRMSIRPQWQGLRAHIEIMTRDDKPYVGVTKHPEQFEASDGRSGFGIARVVSHSGPEHFVDSPNAPLALWDINEVTPIRFISELCKTTSSALERLQLGTCTTEDVRWLTSCIASGVLRGTVDSKSPTNELVSKYRRLENSIPIAKRSPGVYDDPWPKNSEFFPRGNHRRPQHEVARRYLSIFHSDSADYAGKASGRLTLANEIANPSNPLTSRVFVNRVWNWLFGAGLVATVDNFGQMGEMPSHPELLDHLALEFVENGWSVKQLVRDIVMSEAWRRSSTPTSQSTAIDPGNRLWSHASVRRMEAESIRDSMLQLAGANDIRPMGLGTRTFYRSVYDPNKQAPPGPIDGDHRRTIFLEVRRNFPQDFLASFDFPKPISTVGRRSETTVATQSLALMNDPLARQLANEWGDRVFQTTQSSEHRVRMMYRDAFSREPEPAEVDAALGFVGADRDQRPEGWRDLAHALINMKEFIFIR